MANLSKRQITKVLGATGGQLHAILACVYGIERDALPRFVGKAVETSDGYLMCSFVGRNGEYHGGAFVGSSMDLWRNVWGLSAFLKFRNSSQNKFGKAVDNWIQRL